MDRFYSKLTQWSSLYLNYGYVFIYIPKNKLSKEIHQVCSLSLFFSNILFKLYFLKF